MRPDRQTTPLIVTAAARLEARALLQLLLSARRQGEHERSQWAVYDLGLSAADRKTVSRYFPWVRLLQWDSLASPCAAAPCRVPQMLAAAAGSHAGAVLWLDSSVVLTAPLDALLERLARQGFWGLRASQALMKTCTPGQMDAMDVPLEIRHLRGWLGTALGFDTRHPLGKSLLDAWGTRGAADQDEAILNCLLAKAVFAEAFALEDADQTAPWAQPCAVLSTHNQVRNVVPLWADPAARAWHAARKGANRLLHRLCHSGGSRINGFNRRRREHFTIKFHKDGKGGTVEIPSPSDGYFADPFLHVRDGRIWLFAELFHYKADRGQLSVMELDAEGGILSQAPAIFTPAHAALDCHASFPFVFAHAGLDYMIPETHERGTVDLFVCERWPDRWRLRRRLLCGVDAVDSMIIQNGGTWFLVTSVKGAWPNRHLEIHMMDDLLAGPITAHPINARGLYGGKANGTGRNAGFLGRQQDGTLMRLMQDSPHHYGEGLRPMRILDLTRQAFHEAEALSIDLFPGFHPGFCSHHASRDGDIVVWDVRDRTG